MGIGERIASAGGALAPGTKAAQIDKSLGEILDDGVLTAIGWGGSIGSAALGAPSLGALVGAPACAGSVTLMVAGMGNAAAGLQEMIQVLTTGSATLSATAAATRRWGPSARGRRRG